MKKVNCGAHCVRCFTITPQVGARLNAERTLMCPCCHCWWDAGRGRGWGGPKSCCFSSPQNAFYPSYLPSGADPYSLFVPASLFWFFQINAASYGLQNTVPKLYFPASFGIKYKLFSLTSRVFHNLPLTHHSTQLHPHTCHTLDPLLMDWLLISSCLRAFAGLSPLDPLPGPPPLPISPTPPPSWWGRWKRNESENVHIMLTGYKVHTSAANPKSSYPCIKVRPKTIRSYLLHNKIRSYTQEKGHEYTVHADYVSRLDIIKQVHASKSAFILDWTQNQYVSNNIKHLILILPALSAVLSVKIFCHRQSHLDSFHCP